MATLKSCLEWASTSVDQCTSWQTSTERTCNNWDSNCCTWWPCSWGCKLLTWICMGWSYVTTAVCLVWTVVVTTVCVAWSIVEIILVPVAWLVALIMAIPIVGRIIKWIRDFVREIVSRLLGILEFLGSLVGIKLLKKVKLCIIILRDEAGNPLMTEAAMQPFIASAQSIYLAQCNVQVQVEGLHTADKAAPTNALDVGCNEVAAGEDLWTPGSYFEFMSNWFCPVSSFGRLAGLSPTMVVFVVRTIGGAGSGTIGCALWGITDYVTLAPDFICNSVLAHEMGHKTGLWHDETVGNLMNGNCAGGGTSLSGFQQAMVRSSPYVSYWL